MKRSLLLLVALATLAPAGRAGAEPLRLTLDDAVTRALSQAQEIRIADAQITQASGRVKEALSVALPQVSGSLTYGRRFASVFQSAAPDTSFLADVFKNSPFGSVHTWTAEATASQLLWSGGRVGAGLAAARAYRKSFRAQREQVAADLVYQVERAYLEAAVSRQVLEISRAGLEQARAHLTQVAAWNKQGSRSEYDLIRAQVDAANEEPPVVAASNATELAMLELKRLLDLPLDQEVELTTPLEFENGEVPVLDESAMVASADGSARASLAQADAEVDARRQLVRVEKAGHWPQLSVSGTLQQQAFPHTERPRIDDFHRNLEASVKLEFPLVLGYKTFGGIQRASAELRQSEVERDRLREQVGIEVARARQEVRRTLAELVARRGTAQLAARAHHLSEVRFKNGLSTQLEVTDARVQAQTASIHQVQAIKDYRLALLELERAVGRKLPTVRQPFDQLTASLEAQER
jgi:outer membrane protein TolC